MEASLGRSIRPCGQIVDGQAAQRAYETLAEAAEQDSWRVDLDAAWAGLSPIFAASPYLAMLARQSPDRLRRSLQLTPSARLNSILVDVETAGQDSTPGEASRALRSLKADVHLLIGMADIGGVWGLTDVTRALSQFADAAVAAAMRIATSEQRDAGRLTPSAGHGEVSAPGLFCIAMGKHGANELNYSSDIDISFFYDPDLLPLAPGIAADALARQLVARVAELLQARTPEGYVFRVDLRLRPDPAATPIAVPVSAAYIYYETVGQNWERAAFIKARIAAGDFDKGSEFLNNISPFIWRKNLDFAAISDIRSIKRQIYDRVSGRDFVASGADLKLGRGGIRDIEFFVQTQQLILGGRHAGLRLSRTLDGLRALAELGIVEPQASQALQAEYERLRTWEHRAQIIADEQTHRLPTDDKARLAIAALSGFDSLAKFDRAVATTLRRVNSLCGKLFADEPSLSSRSGSLIFTGVDDDPETLATLGRMGFEQPAAIAGTIRAWHHGRVPATRTERGRELFTRLAPRLLEATSQTGAPDAAFRRFADFFAGLTAGVQVQSLLLANPKLLELLVRIMAFAPRFAATLARRPEVLDTLLDPAFFERVTQPPDLGEADSFEPDFEASMNSVRRLHREQTFRIGVQVLAGVVTADNAGNAFADLADCAIARLSDAALREVERKAGVFSGDVVVIALGKCGSREMSARSDLDLMTLYRPHAPDAASSISLLGAETFYARFTQRLVAALSAPTAEGTLYEVDLQLRPSGTKGPVAVSLAAFRDYYDTEAEVWERLALTRARVVWSSSSEFEAVASAAIRSAVKPLGTRRETAREVKEMRALMRVERPPAGFWDMKLVDGGLVDIEFTAQFLQLVNAERLAGVRQNTEDALVALNVAGLAPRRALTTLLSSWKLHQALSQLLKVALDDGADPDSEAPTLQRMLARAGRASDFPRLKVKLERSRRASHAAFERLVR